jgi:hypothetical protein
MCTPVYKRTWYWAAVIGLITLALAFSGCTPAEPAQPPTLTDVPQPSDTPTTAPTETPVPTETPLPTETPTPTPTLTATPDATATAAFEATQAAAALIEEIKAELQTSGFSAEGGNLAYHTTIPVTMRLDGYSTHRWIPLAEGQMFKDFALRADVTWESTSGFVTCGFWFRGVSDDKDAEHNTFEAVRLSGLPAWSVFYWKFNRIRSSLTGNWRVSPEIRQDQGSTNEYMFIMEGTTLKIYVNGESLGGVTITRPEEGIVAFYISQESGETSCTFDNVWLWEMGDEG